VRTHRKHAFAPLDAFDGPRRDDARETLSTVVVVEVDILNCASLARVR